jgi:hypothetical protein
MMASVDAILLIFKDAFHGYLGYSLSESILEDRYTLTANTLTLALTKLALCRLTRRAAELAHVVWQTTEYVALIQRRRKYVFAVMCT